MIRENRYIVIKRKHLDLLTDEANEELENILEAIRIARQKNIDTGANDIECVVVEHDWPMYEDTWNAIEQWVDGLDREERKWVNIGT